MNKTLWWVVGAVAVVLVILAVKNSDKPVDVAGSPSPSASVSPSVSPKPTSTTGIGAGACTAAYTALVNQYGSNRIQFDMYCQAVPSTATFKTGTYVMFDNRSGDARVINIGGIKYNFPGYGYRIIKLGSTKLPATVKLDCGTAVNVGTITVQK
jgi:hypothetical protein